MKSSYVTYAVADAESVVSRATAPVSGNGKRALFQPPCSRVKTSTLPRTFE
jgi:hypothetical protein